MLDLRARSAHSQLSVYEVTLEQLRATVEEADMTKQVMEVLAEQVVFWGGRAGWQGRTGTVMTDGCCPS
jgi:hypothetical protein